jgi:hypothetical protein
MKVKQSLVLKGGDASLRVVRPGSSQSKLPLPESGRRRQHLDRRRERIWPTRLRFFVGLEPQFREASRKIMASMDRAGLQEMPGRFRMGLFMAWATQGTAKKMKKFIAALLKGTVFVMNHRSFLPDNLPRSLSKEDLLRSFLVYDPVQHPNLSIDQAVDATLFFTFLGAGPDSKPWIQEWISDIKTLRKELDAEFGQKAAQELWTPTAASDSGAQDCRMKAAPQQILTKVAYY